MNYKSHYDKLIHRAQNRSILKGEYKEIHHIIPTCIGGSDLKENLTPLFPEEHLLAHLLLVKIYPNEYGLTKAANMMTHCKTSDQKRITNKKFGWIKRKLSMEQSIEMTGSGNHNYGTVWSEEQRNKLRGENNPIHKLNGTHSIYHKDYIDKRGRTKEEIEQLKLDMAKKQSLTKKEKGIAAGKNNSRAKKINIYNSNNKVIFECHGNLRKICSENNLPFMAFFKSQKAGGTLLYQNMYSNKKRLKESGMIIYQGWYAKEV